MSRSSHKPFRLRGITTILLFALIGLIFAYGIPILAQAEEWFLQFIKSLLLIAALILGLAEIRRLNSRLAHLSRVAIRFGQGNYDSRAEVEGKDSVALVGHALNIMAEQIEGNIRELENSHGKLAESQQKLENQNQELSRAYDRQIHFGEFLAKLSSIDTHELIRGSFDDLTTAARAQIGVLFLFNEETQLLERLVETGVDRKALKQMLPENGFDGLHGEVFTRRDWIVLSDLAPGILPEINLGFATVPLQTIYAIPLLFHNKALGSVILASVHEQTESDRRTIKNYTRALAQALNNAMTHQAVRQQTLQFETANLQLTKLDRQRRRFVANMNHELRTPLNSIIGFSSLLLKNRDGSLSSENLDHIEKIHRNGRNLLGIINGILELSKLESEYPETVFITTDPRPLLREVAEMLQPQASAKGIEVILDLPEEIPPIETDSQKLRQIIINLANNAIKFTDSGNVTIHLTPETELFGTEIRVVDTGIGISEDKLDFIFDAFRQADSTTCRTYGGTGLGLTISQSLASLLGGKIRAESRLGSGSIFTLELPKSPPTPENETSRANQQKTAAVDTAVSTRP